MDHLGKVIITSVCDTNSNNCVNSTAIGTAGKTGTPSLLWQRLSPDDGPLNPKAKSLLGTGLTPSGWPFHSGDAILAVEAFYVFNPFTMTSNFLAGRARLTGHLRGGVCAAKMEQTHPAHCIMRNAAIQRHLQRRRDASPRRRTARTISRSRRLRSQRGSVTPFFAILLMTILVAMLGSLDHSMFPAPSAVDKAQSASRDFPRGSHPNLVTYQD
jgi:hypothetical protein